MPVNMIVLVALGLLALVVIGSFFISGFGEASASVNVVDADQADCQSLCQSLSMIAQNYNTCPDINENIKFSEWRVSLCYNFGDCVVNARRQSNCRCTVSGCAGSPLELCEELCGEFQAIGGSACSSHGTETYFTYCSVSHECPVNSDDCDNGCLCNGGTDECGCV